jgi:hypothetical protein
MPVTPDVSVRDLLNSIARQLRFEPDPGCFGLSTIINNEEVFLPTSSLLQVYMPAHAAVVLSLFFNVEFYLDPLTGCESVVYWYFRQVLSDVISQRVSATPKELNTLSGLALQATYGDYNPEAHPAGYFTVGEFYPPGLCQDSPDLSDILTRTLCGV